jgi:hypothetical protein
MKESSKMKEGGDKGQREMMRARKQAKLSHRTVVLWIVNTSERKLKEILILDQIVPSLVERGWLKYNIVPTVYCVGENKGR